MRKLSIQADQALPRTPLTQAVYAQEPYGSSTKDRDDRVAAFLSLTIPEWPSCTLRDGAVFRRPESPVCYFEGHFQAARGAGGGSGKLPFSQLLHWPQGDNLSSIQSEHSP